MSYPASGTTAISDVDIVDPPPKQRSMTTDVLGGMESPKASCRAR
jgi:hypothetical protein